MEKFKKIKDSFGEVKININKEYGIQTQRALDNFSLHDYPQPIELIHALLLIKAAAAKANFTLKELDEKKSHFIYKVALELIKENGKNFPLSIFQSGSGTQTNMNVNEVIAAKVNKEVFNENFIHPNNDVNMSQSSNDTFSAAMNISSYIFLQNIFLPELKLLKDSFVKKQKQFKGINKLGRTHLMDAVPISFSQEFSAYKEMIFSLEKDLIIFSRKLLSTALGGTAVGTGLNTPKNYDKVVHKELEKLTGIKFMPSTNKFKELSSHQELVKISSLLKILALDLLKIANDLRWSGSGPSGGINELMLPENEQGSSIMPGKINPTQIESMSMVCAKVIGNDATISFCESQGNFQLNVYKPIIIFSLLESLKILTLSIKDFRIHCLEGITINEENTKKHLEESFMIITALNKKIGYDNGAKIVKMAKEEKISLKDAGIKLNLLTEKDFKNLLKIASKG